MLIALLLKREFVYLSFFLSDLNSSVSTNNIEVYKKLDIRINYLDRDAAFNCLGFYSNIII